VLGRLAEDAIVFVRRGVAQNKSAPIRLLTRLCDDDDVVVRTLALRNLIVEAIGGIRCVSVCYS